MLGRGLSKRSEAVKRVVEKEMIPGLLSLSNNNIAHHLAVGNSDTLYMELVSSVHLTRGEDMLQSYDPNKPTNILKSCTINTHDSLAMAVCNEILSSPDSFQTEELIKILTSLSLTQNNYMHLKGVKVLVESLLQKVKERFCVR